MNNSSQIPHKEKHPSREMMYAYLDDELSPGEEKGIKRHLARCSQCATRMARIQATFSDLQGLPPLPLDTDLTPRILHRLQTREAPFPALSWIAVLQMIAAAALLFFTLPTLSLLPGAQGTWSQWMKGLSLVHIRLFDTARGLETSLQLNQQIWERFSTYVFRFPTPEIDYLPVWTFFLITALLGILGNTLLLKNDNNR